MDSASKCLANSVEVEKSLALRRAVEIIMEEALLKLLLKELPKRYLKKLKTQGSHSAGKICRSLKMSRELVKNKPVIKFCFIVAWNLPEIVLSALMSHGRWASVNVFDCFCFPCSWLLCL